MSAQDQLLELFKRNPDLAARNAGLVVDVAVRPSVRIPKNDYKAQLVQQLLFAGIEVEAEFAFSPRRKFRADWRVVRYKDQDAKPKKVLIEFEGGLFEAEKSGHSSVSGILRDIVKSNEAQLCGFIMIRVAPNHVSSGEALAWVEAALLMTP